MILDSVFIPEVTSVQDNSSFSKEHRCHGVKMLVVVGREVNSSTYISVSMVVNPIVLFSMILLSVTHFAITSVLY